MKSFVGVVFIVLMFSSFCSAELGYHYADGVQMNPIPINTPTPTDTPLCYNDGDVNRSMTLTAEDAQLTFGLVLGLWTPTFQEECSANCNGDASITAGDAQNIFFTVLGVASCADDIVLPTVTPTVTPTATPTALPTDTPTATPTVTPTEIPTPVELLDQSNTSYNMMYSNILHWQSFTAGITGILSRIEVSIAGSSFNNGNVLLYEGEGTSGMILGFEPSQNGPSYTWMEVTFNSMPYIEAGQVYTFALEGDVTALYADSSNPYPGGRSNSNPGRDLCFKTYVLQY